MDLYFDSAPDKPVPFPIITEKCTPCLYRIMQNIIVDEGERNRIPHEQRVATREYLNTFRVITCDNFDEILQEALGILYGIEKN